MIRALLSGDKNAFYTAETESRRVAGLPPFGRLAAVVVSGPDKMFAEGYARALARAAPRDQAITLLGPAEAALAMVRGRHRYRLLIMAPRQFDLQSYLRHWLGAGPKPTKGLRVQVDIDPQHFM